MAIGNQTRDQVIQGMTTSNTTEAAFVNSVTQLIDQVAENTDDIEVTRSLNVTGDVAGTHSFHLDAPEDSELDIQLLLTTDAVQTANIQDGQVTTDKVGTNAVTLGEKTNGNYVATIATDNGLSGASATEGGTPTIGIADLGVSTAKLAEGAVTNNKITDATIANAKLVNDSVTVSGFGGGRDVTIALGATGTLPTFSGDSDGLVPGYNGTELRSTEDRAILASNGEWYTVESWALSTTEIIPSSRVATVGQSHTLSYTADVTYPNTAAGARAFVAESDNRTFALARNDTISVTETGSGVVYVFSYVGAGVAANVDANVTDLVSLGSVDAYAAGTGLTLSGNTFSITNLGVNTAQLANSSVTTAKIAADAVDGTKIADNAIGTEHIAAGAVGTTDIADAAVTTPKIADDAVDSDKIAPSSVRRDHLIAGGSLASGRLLALDADNNLEWIDGGNVIGESVVSYHNITSVANQTAYTLPGGASVGAAFVYVNGVLLHEGVDYTFNNAGTTFTLTSAVAAGLAIQVAAFANANALGNGSITGANLVDGAVSTDKLAADAVTGAKIADDAIDTEHIEFTGTSTNNWTFGVDSSNRLTISFNGTVRFRFDTDGHFHAEDDITAFASL